MHGSWHLWGRMCYNSSIKAYKAICDSLLYMRIQIHFCCCEQFFEGLWHVFLSSHTARVMCVCTECSIIGTVVNVMHTTWVTISCLHVHSRSAYVWWGWLPWGSSWRAWAALSLMSTPSWLASLQHQQGRVRYSLVAMVKVRFISKTNPRACCSSVAVWHGRKAFRFCCLPAAAEGDSRGARNREESTLCPSLLFKLLYGEFVID